MDIKESKAWKEAMLKARVKQVRAKINSIENLTKKMFLGGYDVEETRQRIKETREEMRLAQAEAERLAKELRKDFSWSEELKKEGS